MLLGVNAQNEILAIGEIPEGLNIIEVPDDTFLGTQEPLQYKIKVGENWVEITPKFPTRGL